MSTNSRGHLSTRLLQHCNLVLQNLAKFHAMSLFIAKISQQPLSDLFPFAVEAESFRQEFKDKIIPIKEELKSYLCWSNLDDSIDNSLDLKIQSLFWKLVELKAKPLLAEKEVLIHGNLNFSNIMFK